MLPLMGLAVAFSGLPVWVCLVGVSSVGAVAGLLGGVFDPAVLSALAPRLMGLLEHDLLQALPLYVLLGMLLQRLALAPAVFKVLAWGLRGTGAGTGLAAMGLGALVAPMNGSVASSSALLSRLLVQPLRDQDGPASAALVSAAATVGVVVPPSLVLILLGDAMMNAHTEALLLPSRGPSVLPSTGLIINTQGVFRAALWPAAAVLLLWMLVLWWRGRRAGGSTLPGPARPSAREAAMAALAIAGVLGLLAGVFSGRLRAVEGAATGAVLLLGISLLSRAFDRPAWISLMRDTLALSGALFALLVGATSFSLVLRLWGAAQWVSQTVLDARGPAVLVAAVILLGVGACAWVLDAFEMIFVVVPLVAPGLIVRLADAQQVAVLLLLILQASFLVPPMGYAVMLARGPGLWPAVTTRQMGRAVAPYLAAQGAVLLGVLLWPGLVHRFDPAEASLAPAHVESQAEITQRMIDMAKEADPPPQAKP
jgi:TRAP-type mannitol/chloroaromatic compound transport system permease large subunit